MKIDDNEFKIPTSFESVTNNEEGLRVESAGMVEIKKVTPPPTPKNPPKTKTQKKSTNTKKKL